MKRLRDARPWPHGVLCCAWPVPAAHAIEILRWERLPLGGAAGGRPGARGVHRAQRAHRRAGGVGEQLRVQSAGGAIYLRANAPIPPTRLQLQDVESAR